MPDLPRDRLRALLDAVLDDEHHDLASMAAGAHASPFHFARQLRGATGEPPVALRRRVLLERAAWRIQRGTSVTDAAFEAGYDSVEGFARAFGRAYGHAPSATPPASTHGHWLPAPNGIHFHGPSVLYVDAGESREHPSGDVLELLVRHDVDDVTALLDAAQGLSHPALVEPRLPGHVVLDWSGPEETLLAVLHRLATGTLPWLATLEGADEPRLPAEATVDELAALHAEAAPRWLAWVRDTERRGAWGDSVVDALCDPPESFLLAQVVSHVLTFSAHRRQVARWMLRAAGVAAADLPDPDPITWHRRRTGDLP